MSSRSMKFWKCSIYFYLIFFAVSGLFLGSVTSFVLIQTFGMGEFYDPNQTSIYFLYAPTFLIFIMAGVSWRAVKSKYVLLLKFFSVSQVVIILLELIGSVWNLVSMQTIHEKALPIFEAKFMELRKDHNSDIWDTMQRKLKCCGIHGAFDYKTLNIVPFSCCNQASTGHFPAFCVSVYHEGCLGAFTENISENFAILAAVSAALALLQIPGVFATWYFANRTRRDKTEERNRIVNQKLLVDKKGTVIKETAT
ncbi:UNVERIFIED_CONTAM: hypothetical protein PYX00_005507 [Menopon gallinae]|uniref:Tetraspanin n=1 Tax=Menopon gallinae TaxID=328185 RepID=A0AAW2HRX6_9NEOP